MGFGREARRVRDTSLPDRYRVHALGSCIQIAQPIGFNATWSYLSSQVGGSWRQVAFLVPAMELLEAVRSHHLALTAEYADLRWEQKAGGYRFPPRQDATPSDPFRWHGDERVGARHALASWRLRRADEKVATHRVGGSVLAVVDQALQGEEFPKAEPDELQYALNWARYQVHVLGWEGDPIEYRIAWDVYRALGQLHILANGAPSIGKPWNFA